MKRFYSVILFFSFVAGAIQPFIPAMEYHFFKEYIIEHHCVNKDNPDVECDGLCYLTEKIDHAQHNQEDHTRSASVKYYPGAVFHYENQPLMMYPGFKHLSFPGLSQSPLQGMMSPPVPPPRS